MGFPFREFFGVVTQVAPMLLPIVPGGAIVAPFLPTILEAIADAEKKPGTTGPEKRTYVQEIVADGAHVANQARPGSVDEALVVEAAGHYVDAIIQSVNAVQKAKAALPDVPAIVQPAVQQP